MFTLIRKKSNIFIFAVEIVNTFWYNNLKVIKKQI